MALAPRFTMLSTNAQALDALLEGRAETVRAIATRGREPADDALIARLPNLELIASFAVGYDSIDLDAARARGIVVTNTPDEVADFAVGLPRALDVLVVIPPGGAATRHIVDAPIFEALGPTGILINVARGSVVDEAALVEALRAGTILCAGLDVFASERAFTPALAVVDTVVLTPQAGSATHHTRRLMAALGERALVSWFAGNGPVTPVPETPWPAS